MNLIDEANKRVSIVRVCRMIGMSVPEGTAAKLYCPFGDLAHSDGGMTKAFRVYPETNSAYCFACRQYFSPVSLYSHVKDIRRQDAALILLEEIGWKPVSHAEKWESLVRPEEERVDTSMLALALRTYCARVCSEWEELQLTPDISSLLGRCLALLDRVRSTEDAERWLSTCKTVMRTKLEAAENDIR